MTSRELNRQRRSQLKREELEKELEAAEDALEAMKESYEKKQRDMQASFEEELSALQESHEKTTAEMTAKEFKISHAFAEEIDALRTQLLKATAHSETHEATLTDMSEQLDECISSNSALSQEICQLKCREEELQADYEATVAELERKLRDANQRQDFAIQVKANETELLKSHLDECLATKRGLESELAVAQVKLSEASTALWALQDKSEAELQSYVTKEQALCNQIEQHKKEFMRLSMESTGAQQVLASLEDRLTKTLAENQLAGFELADCKERITQLTTQLNDKDAEMAQMRQTQGECVSLVIY